MDEEIKISVVIPAYNRENTIEKCLKSVINQSYAPYEIIVVDDGSTDHTINKIEEMHCDKIRILKQNHKGAQAARNKGIVEAKGDYIAFLDSDDEWLLNKLECQVPYLHGRTDVVVYCDCYEVNRIAGQIRARITNGGNGNVYKEMLMSSGPTFPGIVCSKKALMDIGLLDEKVPAHQEWETSIRLAKNNEFVHIREPLFKWNWHDGETISKDTLRNIKGYEYIVNKYKFEILKNNGVEGLKDYYEDLLNKGIECENYKFNIFFLRWMCLDIMSEVRKKLRGVV
jgi:glycosyltransferase involved in cell wall biosynthesis